MTSQINPVSVIEQTLVQPSNSVPFFFENVNFNKVAELLAAGQVFFEIRTWFKFYWFRGYLKILT